LRVVSLRAIAKALVEGRLAELAGCVGLSFDDGSDFDWHDLPHPTWGAQRSMANILRDFRARHGAHAQPALNATSFAIVSPEARAELDRTCMIGCGWWNDDWWAAARAEGLVDVESHGWDHNHETLRTTVTSAPRGAFDVVARAEADAEIAQATRFLKSRRGGDDEVLFAYPYVTANDYLSKEYFPDATAEHGAYAAFTTGSDPVVAGTSRWRIPRHVFGHHWKSPDELERLLCDQGAIARLARFLRGPRRTKPASPLPVDPDPREIGDWRQRLRCYEVNDARALAGALFRKSFGQPVPDYPRHFVLVHSPYAGETRKPEVVAYVHHSPFENVFLAGGMCADPAAYRTFPKPLFDSVKRDGGLATIVMRESFALLGEAPAVFGHVGEPRARQADLRAGFVDTGRTHLMAVWRKPLADGEKEQLLDKVEALGPF
jgi:peptidoglycan/xylan/chitin deacetylase (PgdA/CDA1 family)